MDNRLGPLYEILKLNTRLFHNCLEDVDDLLAGSRVSGSANNMAFIAAHLVDARRFMGEYLGLAPELLPAELLSDARSIDDVKEYPALDWLKDAWQRLSKALMERYAGISSAELEAFSSRAFPVEDGTVLGGIAFLLEHESYHIGQLSLLRRLLGLNTMSYF